MTNNSDDITAKDDLIVLINFSDRRAKAPHRCVFEDVADPNPINKTASTGKAEFFSYTDTMSVQQPPSAKDIMAHFGNAGFTQGRFDFIIRRTEDVKLNAGFAAVSTDMKRAKDAQTHNQVQKDFDRRMKNGGGAKIAHNIF